MTYTNALLRSAKRTSNERQGVHSWHPYYAGYSEQFVSSAIQYMSIKKGIILDPWAGSGTTNLICERLGISSIGFDINPAMVYFAAAKQGYTLNNLDINQLEKAIKRADLGTYRKPINAELLEILSPSLARYILALIELVFSLSLSSPCTKKIHFAKKSNCVDPIRAFLISCVFATARELAGYRSGSNPTWFRKIEKKPTYRQDTIKRVFVNRLFSMLDDLRRAHSSANSESINLSCIEDSRKMPIPDQSIDGVVTSPPYLTRIDYAVSTKLELLLLADHIEFRNIRENTMGAPVIKSGKITISDEWGKKAVRLLHEIENHYSKASRSYYFKNKLQYFQDAHSSLKEIYRVLKPGSKALIVVQSSYYKEIEIPLGEIFTEMGKKLHFNSKIMYREEVRGHMAHVNIKSSQYKGRKVYFEDVVELLK